jgi:broad specificity phosphatase PhoE
MLTVYLLRHGETFYNADGNRYCGATDIGLTDKGIGQAYTAAVLLKNLVFAPVYSSPLQGALITAQIASGRRDVIGDNRLTDANFGITAFSWISRGNSVC